MTLKQIERLPRTSVRCVANMSNSYVEIENKIYYVKRLNDFGEMALYSFDLTENMFSIANIWPNGIQKNYFTIKFIYNGLSCEKRIRYSEVKTLKDPLAG